MDKTPVPGRIFVSYRRNDSAYPTGWLTDRLVEHYGPRQVFTDVDSIELGDDFVEKITTAVASCDVLLAVIGPRWLTAADENGDRRLEDPNDYVRIEIEAALRRQVLVVPILVDGATMPRVSDLPGRPAVPGDEPESHSLATLPNREALALLPEQFDWAVGRLLTKLDGVLTGSPKTPTPKPRPRQEPGPPSDKAFPSPVRWGIVGALAAVVLLMLVLATDVVPDVATARHLQPQGPWITGLWLLLALAAVVTLALVLGNREPLVGSMLGFVAIATWLVAESWTVLKGSDDPVDTHDGVHVLLLLLLAGTTVAVATAPSVRERVRVNSSMALALALILAALGYLLRLQAVAIDRAVTSGDPLTWAAQGPTGPSLVVLAVCVVAAIVHGNSVQTRALRTFVGLVVVFQMIVVGGQAYAALGGTSGADVTPLRWGLAALGSLLLWWAVCVGQPKRREVQWQARHASRVAALP